MIETTESSKGQVIRADHLFYVTLKYTRTGDIIKSIVKRLLSTLEYVISEILEEKKVKNVPLISLMKANLLSKKFKKNKEIKKLVNFYLYLKKIDKGKYRVICEYRKGVAIIVDNDEINIAKLRELLEKTKEFVRFADNL